VVRKTGTRNAHGHVSAAASSAAQTEPADADAGSDPTPTEIKPQQAQTDTSTEAPAHSLSRIGSTKEKAPKRNHAKSLPVARSLRVPPLCLIRRLLSDLDRAIELPTLLRSANSN
jgi:hypothetical protein